LAVHFCSWAIINSGTLQPYDYTIPATDGGIPVISFTPVGYLARIFQFYKGSLVITIKIAKTQFHAGRLAFIYNLTDHLQAEPTPTLANLPYTHKEIIDITKGSEFSFEIPYISSQPWSLTNPYSATIGHPGSWWLMVIEPLSYTATVPNAVRINFEVSGGKSLTFAGPRGILNLSPTTIANFQGATPIIGDDIGLNKTVVGLESDEDKFTDAATCFGESVLSLRSLLKRGGIAIPGTTISATGGFFYPNLLTMHRAIGGPPSATGVSSYDPYNFIGCCYALGRGGFRITLLSATGGNTTSTAFITYSSNIVPASIVNPVQAAITLTAFLQGGSAYPLIGTDYRVGGNAIQTPQYLPVAARNLFDNTITATNGVPNDDSIPTVDRNAIIIRTAGTALAAYAYRAVSDDHNMACFISIPPFTATTI